jgi:CBS domain containing-hemolysin-like protein
VSSLLGTANPAKALLGQTAAVDLLPNWQATQFYTLQPTNTVSEAVDRLMNSPASALPVVKPQSFDIVGFVSWLDLAAFAAATSPDVSIGHRSDHIQARTEAGQKLMSTAVQEVINFSKSDPCVTLASNSSALQAAEILATGVHRILLKDATTGHAVGVVTQTDVCKWLYYKMASERDKTSMKQFGAMTLEAGDMAYKRVYAVDTTSNVHDALQVMQTIKVHNNVRGSPCGLARLCNHTL